jgi:hypothetical protein
VEQEMLILPEFTPMFNRAIGENENQYGYIIEMHYNNPGGVAGILL